MNSPCDFCLKKKYNTCNPYAHNSGAKMCSRYIMAISYSENYALSSKVELLKELIEITEDPVLESHLHVRILKDKLAYLERELADNKEIK